MKPYVVVADHLPAEGRSFSVQMNREEVDALLAERGISGVQAESPLRAEVRLLPSGSDLFCLGRYEASISGPCSRCLEPAAESVEGEFHLTYVREGELPRGSEQELHREDLDLEVLTDGSIDLNEVVAEQFVLGLPTHLLCTRECRGLCPSCGVNLNREQCGCGPRPADPRFAVLASLRASDDDVGSTP